MVKDLDTPDVSHALLMDKYLVGTKEESRPGLSRAGPRPTGLRRCDPCAAKDHPSLSLIHL